MTKRKRPEVRVTLSTFDKPFDATTRPTYRSIRTDVPLNTFKPITKDDYVPAGSTPLRDAVGKFIEHLSSLRDADKVTVGVLLDESGSMNSRYEEALQSVNDYVDGLREVKVDPDAAGKVLCVIVTDGGENASKEYSHEAVTKLISNSESNGFTMIFLGAGYDAWNQGASLGLSGGVTGQYVSYSGAAGSTQSAMNTVTSDSQSFLSDVKAYNVSRSGSTMRSVTDDGNEVLSNINAGK